MDCFKSIFFSCLLLVSLFPCLRPRRDSFGFYSEDDTAVDLTALEELRVQAQSIKAESWSDNDERLDILFRQFGKIYNRPYVSDEEEYELRKKIFLVSWW